MLGVGGGGRLRMDRPQTEEGVVAIPLHRRDGSVRAYALVDGDDYERVRGYRWSVGGNGDYVLRYFRHEGRKTAESLHRTVMRCVRGDGVVVDHVNGDHLDCRRSNLRVGTQGLNLQNRTRLAHGTSSSLRGVSWCKRTQRWRACAKLNGKFKALGYFDSEQDAGAAAAAFRAEHMPFSAEAAA